MLTFICSWYDSALVACCDGQAGMGIDASAPRAAAPFVDMTDGWLTAGVRVNIHMGRRGLRETRAKTAPQAGWRA